jgi:hypothetical protein
MHRLAAVVIPILAAVGASFWLYGRPGLHQRPQAPRSRHRLVLALALFSAASAVLAFVTRADWVGDRIASDVAVSLFLGLILLTLALLYATLPPQRDL